MVYVAYLFLLVYRLYLCIYFFILFFFFFFNDTATTEIYTLSLHDALPISRRLSPLRREVFQARRCLVLLGGCQQPILADHRSEEHTSELQSQSNLVCRLLLEKKKKQQSTTHLRLIM